MVLVTGPTGSGKTTTLYGALAEITSSEDKIVTLEDPVEYQLKGITQIPITERKGLTFARGLRSILRTRSRQDHGGGDPRPGDGADRDSVSPHGASGLHHGAREQRDRRARRFRNMGVEAYQFVSSLNCVLAQRLVRTICRDCRHPVTIPEEELREAKIDPAGCGGTHLLRGRRLHRVRRDRLSGPDRNLRASRPDDHIRELILRQRPTSEIKQAARDAGMRFLRESAVEQVLQGRTTLHEINKVTFVA